MAAAKRAIMLGLDALVPNTLERFVEEGVLPNFARLLERGSMTRVRPMIPAQTPTNWSTLATGATPGGHGVVQWGSHIPGQPVWEYNREEAFNAGLCRAEYLWEAAERAGLRSVVMNYAGYPPTTDAACFIEWLFQPARSYFDLAEATVYHNCPDQNTTDPIELRDAEGWSGLPESSLPSLSAGIIVAQATGGQLPAMGLLVYAEGGGYDTVAICEGAGASEPLATLKVGEWSDWVRAQFVAEEGSVQGAFRFKLLELAPDGTRLRLFRTDAFPTDGSHCSQPDVAARLMEELGPYVHAGSACGLHCKGWLEWETVAEVLAAEAEWWPRAARIAMEETDASIVVLHWHILDAMGHRFVQQIDPTGTDYDPETADFYWDVIREYYKAADRLLGAFLEELDDGETVFAAVADHGMPANIKAVSLVNAFSGTPWLALTDDGKAVDWARSKVFFAQNHLWVNLQGRDEGGIVPPAEYESLRSAVMAAMRDIKDPETGEHVMAFVLPREDGAMVGLWGDYVGDLVYCYAGGYRWSGPEVLRMGRVEAVFPCGGGNHGPMIPTYETEATSVMGTLVMAGPGVRAGVKLPKLEQTKVTTLDVAPTLAYLLGIDAPAQNEGRLLREFIADLPATRPRRELWPTARSIVNRPATKPRPMGLQGDVTDEG